MLLLSHCCYLVDPASSHTLVLKIKPCMSKCFVYIILDCGRLIITVIVLLRFLFRWIPVVIPKLRYINHPLSTSNRLDNGCYSPQNECDNHVIHLKKVRYCIQKQNRGDNIYEKGNPPQNWFQHWNIKKLDLKFYNFDPPRSIRSKIMRILLNLS